MKRISWATATWCIYTTVVLLFLMSSANIDGTRAQEFAAAIQQTPLPVEDNTPPGADYRLGPDDTLKITVWDGREYLERNVTVASDGTVMVPFQVNKLIRVTGMTAIELRDLLQRELQKIYRGPVAQVLITGFHSRKAFLLGEIQKPGQYPIAESTTLLEFIVRSGGFLPKSNLSEVRLTRHDGTSLAVNLNDMVLKGDQSHNVILASGDIVFVPSIDIVGKRYFILGQVQNPGVVQSQVDLTLMEAIARAGAFSPSAKETAVYVVRQNVTEEAEFMKIEFSDLYKKGDLSKNIMLRSGDIVYVPKNFKAKLAEVMSAIAPVVSFARDSVILADWAYGGHRE